MNTRLRRLYNILKDEDITPQELISKVQNDKDITDKTFINKCFYELGYIDIYDLKSIYKVVPMKGLNEFIKEDEKLLSEKLGVEINMNKELPQDTCLKLFREISDLSAEFKKTKYSPSDVIFNFYWIHVMMLNARQFSLQFEIPSDVDLKKMRKQIGLHVIYNTFDMCKGNSTYLNLQDQQALLEKGQEELVKDFNTSIIPTPIITRKMKELRSEIKVTRQDVADATGITTAMIGVYEGRQNKMSDDIVRKLAEYFGSRLF